MKTIIIEDEYPAAERLGQLLGKLDAPVEVLAVLQSVSESIRWLTGNPAPDLVFSDIQLSDGLSFQIFEAVPVSSPIVFTTSYDEYAIKAFKVKSIDYLLKPIKLPELQGAVHKFRQMQPAARASDYALRIESLLDSLPVPGKKYKNRFLVKQNEQLLPIAREEIAYFFAGNGLVCLVRHDGRQFIVDYTLEELEQLLEPAHFFRLNRQFITTLPSIAGIHTYFNGKLKLELQPRMAGEVLVSREKVPAFKEWIEGS
jgi:DNA-binding LytR/AlgR family response regulator